MIKRERHEISNPCSVIQDEGVPFPLIEMSSIKKLRGFSFLVMSISVIVIIIIKTKKKILVDCLQ